MKKTILLIGFLFMICTNAFPSDIKVDRLSKNIIVVNDGYFRVIAILTEHGIVLIDTHRSTEDMLPCKKIIEKEFNTDNFKYVINSHEDMEHIQGNPLFKNSTIITAEGFLLGQKFFNSRIPELDKKYADKLSELAQYDSTKDGYGKLKNEVGYLKYMTNAFRAAQLIKPNITFPDRMTLRFDSLTLNIIYFGLGHGHSLFVHIPEESFLFSSTCARGMPPVFYILKNDDIYTDMGRGISVLSEFVERPDTLKYIIPCHREYLSNNDLKEIYGYYKMMWEGICKAKRENKSLESVKSEFAFENICKKFKSIKVSEDTRKQHETNIDLLWSYLERHPEKIKS